MIKGIGKLLKTGVKLGRSFALKAAEPVFARLWRSREAIENVLRGGNSGLNIDTSIIFQRREHVRCNDENNTN